MSVSNRTRFLFPRWANYALPVLIVAVLGGALYVPTLVTFGMGTEALAVGYAPVQPVPYSHALHVGQLGLDCRHCHYTVESTAFAAIPATQTCMNCHNGIKNDGQPIATSKFPSIAKLKESWDTGKPMEWVKVHDLPDYVYFNHSAHVNSGVGCVSCHGRIDTMEVVRQDQRLSMSWCLDCHRHPEQHLRPRDQVTNMHYKPVANEGESLQAAQTRVGLELKDKLKIRDEHYMTSCSTCHR